MPNYIVPSLRDDGSVAGVPLTLDPSASQQVPIDAAQQQRWLDVLMGGAVRDTAGVDYDQRHADRVRQEGDAGRAVAQAARQQQEEKARANYWTPQNDLSPEDYNRM